MEQATDLVWNPTTLLIERLFWLCLGAFLGLAIINSLIRGLKQSKKNTTPISPTELKKFAKKAIQKNTDINKY